MVHLEKVGLIVRVIPSRHERVGSAAVAVEPMRINREGVNVNGIRVSNRSRVNEERVRVRNLEVIGRIESAGGGELVAVER